MKENFPNRAKEIDFQEVQEAQRVPKKLDPRRNTPRQSSLHYLRLHRRREILEASREKDTVTYKRVPIRLSADFSKETLQAVSYTHLTLPTIPFECRSRWSPYH